MKRAFSTLEHCINNRKEDDDYYGKILAIKIRRLPENERFIIINNILTSLLLNLRCPD